MADTAESTVEAFRKTFKHITDDDAEEALIEAARAAYKADRFGELLDLTDGLEPCMFYVYGNLVTWDLLSAEADERRHAVGADAEGASDELLALKQRVKRAGVKRKLLQVTDSIARGVYEGASLDVAWLAMRRLDLDNPWLFARAEVPE